MSHELLPENLVAAAPAALIEASNHLTSALEADEEAAAAAREARAVLERAPEEDAVKTRAAVEAGKATPALSQPKREAEAEAASRRASVAHDLAREAADNFSRVLAQHRGDLAREQAPRVESAAEEAAKTLDQLAGQLKRLAQEAGVLHALHMPGKGSPQAADRRRALGRGPTIELPRFDPLAVPSLEPLRSAIEELRRDATPLRERILDALSAGPRTWEDVAATLGIHPLDDEASHIRGFMVDEGVLEWVDRHGDSLIPASVMAATGSIVVQDRYLRRSEPTPSPTQLAREAARQAA